MIRKFTADIVYPVSSQPIQNGVIVCDEEGKILELSTKDKHDPATLEYFHGSLIPGLVNTHCHLELSHMKGIVDTGTKLIPFIKNVVSKRNQDPGFIKSCIEHAEQEMYHNGIVAVGDISNVTDTFEVKTKSKIRFYTFVECFDFLFEPACDTEFAKYKSVYDQYNTAGKDRKSLVPHAPYSVSRKLFDYLDKAMPQEEVTISMHNQETDPENELFLHGAGQFVDLWNAFNMPVDPSYFNGKTSIHYALEHLRASRRTLLVHNTLSRAEDIAAAHAFSNHVFWATCPNANLYIENRLPEYNLFVDAGAKLTIGTDSLTSNWQLSVLEEMKTILRYQSYLDFETVLQWATLNGAQALGFDDTLGSFDQDKTPGILHLDKLPEETLLSKHQVKRVL